MWIDIGVNLTSKAFDRDREAVLARAREAGVARLVVTGTSARESERAAALARAHPGVLWSTAGVHPHHASEWTAATARHLAALAARPEVVALGECGLDYHRNYSPPEAQRIAFEAQLELAAELGLPVFLHQRDALEDFTRLLDRWRDRLVDAVAHCFTDDAEALARLLDLDLHIGITGWICDERRGTHLCALMERIPEGRLMLETDAPYLLPRDLPDPPKDRRNEPAFLPQVAARVAACRGVSLEVLARETTATAERFFRLPVVHEARS
ncbi:MAG: hydrolase TatD [Gammaproteobacteria bacterium]|nr:MAG: hydrolase TatD [Gammaproteobacteria bacterium]